MRAHGTHGFAAATAGEFRLRALAGGLVATALAVGAFFAAGFAAQLLLLVAGSGALGTLLAGRYESRSPSGRPELRYAAVGAAVAAAALVLLAPSDPAFLLVGALVALPAGAVAGAAGGLSAARLPARALVPAVVLAGFVLLGVGAGALERTRPPLPGSYLLVEGPTTAASARQLAEEVADALRTAADPLSEATWSRVAGAAVTPGEGGSVEIGYARTGARRAITVQVDGRRACVDVRTEQVGVQEGDCPQP